MSDLPHYISYIAFLVRVQTTVDPRPGERVKDFSRNAADRKAEHESSASGTNQTSVFFQVISNDRMIICMSRILMRFSKIVKHVYYFYSVHYLSRLCTLQKFSSSSWKPSPCSLCKIEIVNFPRHKSSLNSLV